MSRTLSMLAPPASSVLADASFSSLAFMSRPRRALPGCGGARCARTIHGRPRSHVRSLRTLRTARSQEDGKAITADGSPRGVGNGYTPPFARRGTRHAPAACGGYCMAGMNTLADLFQDELR